MSTLSSEQNIPAPFSFISKNIDEVRKKIQKAQEKQSAEVKGQNTRLVAVSKTKPIQHIIEAYKNGNQRHFGENYVKELVEKAEQLNEILPDIKWHFIGHLQSNKISKLLSIGPSLFLVETVDSVNIATALNATQKKKNSINAITPQNSESNQLGVMVQVNTSGEEAKSGVLPNETSSLVEFIIEKCDALKFKGLMTIGADYENLTEKNPDFLLLRDLRKKICEELNLDPQTIELSMGMSGDFEEAIELGSTNVRIGSTIFGERVYKT